MISLNFHCHFRGPRNKESCTGSGKRPFKLVQNNFILHYRLLEDPTTQGSQLLQMIKTNVYPMPLHILSLCDSLKTVNIYLPTPQPSELRKTVCRKAVKHITGMEDQGRENKLNL